MEGEENTQVIEQMDEQKLLKRNDAKKLNLKEKIAPFSTSFIIETILQHRQNDLGSRRERDFTRVSCDDNPVSATTQYTWLTSTKYSRAVRQERKRERIYPPGLNLDKPKRIRTAFSEEQVISLEKEFDKNHYVVGEERKKLASELRLSETQVKVWFQNRRTKDKREHDKDKDSDKEECSYMNLFSVLSKTKPVEILDVEN